MIEGDRVRLRPFRDEDRGAFAAMNADPQVMAYFVSPLSRIESDAFLDGIETRRTETGHGFMAVEEKASGELAGMCGLSVVPWVAPFTPAVEIGWRFAPAFQGRGLATEAGTLVLVQGFGPWGLDRIVAFTVPANRPSWRVMERIGMTHVGAFEHPRIPEGHPFRLHVLYEVRKMSEQPGRTAD